MAVKRFARSLAFAAVFPAALALAQEPADVAPAPAPASAPSPHPDAAQGASHRTLRVLWRAPRPLRRLYEKFIPPPAIGPSDQRAVALRAWMRDVRKRVPEIAASEGYFSPTLDIRFTDAARTEATVTVEPGVRTTVGEVDIAFEGDLAQPGPEREKRRRELRAGFTMKPGAPMRSADWDTAKTRLQEALTDEDYAAGVIASSEARVDAEAAKAKLSIVLASGPRFTFGDIYIEGLHRYPEAVIRRTVDLKRGERYSRERLNALQRLVQSGPWFSSVVLDVDRDPAHAELAPVRMAVTERPRRSVALAIGYGTDDGARVETAYRDRNLFDRGLDLQSSIRAGQKDQIGYADVYLPPGLFAPRSGGDIPFTDSFGVLAEHNTIQNLATSRFAVAGYRHFQLDRDEARVGLTYQIERDYPQGSVPRVLRALAPVVSTTWRRVDNLYDPHRGGVLNVQFAVGARALASSENFIKAYAQYQYWYPIGARDQLLMRAELGRTFAPTRADLPEDFLFRAGGSRSNRGYAYQSLGVQEGQAIVGGRYIATGTAEYVHWLNDQWGAAVFTDVGDAADAPGDMHLNPSYGFGPRFRTPAGPLGVDLAFAQNQHHLRLSFSVTVAF